MLKARNLISIIAIILYSCLSFAGAPNYTTFQTKILAPSGLPLENPAVNFRFTILDSFGTCVLYIEDYVAVNMTGSSGVVSFSLGSGTKSYPGTATLMNEVFNNSVTVPHPCQAGGTYAPGSTDRRQIVMQFNDGGGWQTLPQMAINSVFYANYATTAEKLGNYISTDYLRPATLPSCIAGQALHFNGTSFTCVAASGGAGGGPTLTGITSIANASGDITLAPKNSMNSVLINSNVTSTSSTTGSLIVTGGIGASGNVYSGGRMSAATLDVNGTSSIRGVASFTNGASWDDQLVTTTAGGASLAKLAGNSLWFAPGNFGGFDTRLYYGGTNILRTPGALIVDGNVGIGTTNPTAALHVNGANGTVGSPAGAAGLIVNGGSGYLSGNGNGGAVSITAGPSSGSGVAGALNLSAGTSGGLSSAGGLTSISAGDGIVGGSLLLRSGNAWAGNGAATFTMAGSGTITTGGIDMSSGATGGSAGGNGGSISIRTPSTTTGFTATGGNISIMAGAGEFAGSGGTVSISAGGGGASNINGSNVVIDGGSKGGAGVDGNILLVSVRGNVGIGTTTPAAKLDVAGDVKIGNSGASCSATTKGSIRYNDTTSVLEFCNGTAWNLVQAAACTDPTPNVFTFANEANATNSTLYTSNIISLTGINCSVPVTISGAGAPQYQICSDAGCTSVVQGWTNSPSSIVNGQYLQTRLTADLVGGSTFQATIIVGSGATVWSVTTAGGDCTASPAVGTVCADGSIYAGSTPDGGGKMFTTRCDIGQTWDGFNCTGTRSSLPWNNGSANWTSTGVTSTITGRTNSAALDALADAGAPYAAANSCETLSENGRTDWYLPSLNELSVLYGSQSSIRNFNNTALYSSSSENAGMGTSVNYFIGFSNGAVNPGAYSGTKAWGMLVRCVRR